GEYLVPSADVPQVFVPSAGGPRHAAAGALGSAAAQPIQWHLGFAGVEHVVSMRIAGLEPVTRFWVGLADPAEPTAGQIAGLVEAAAASAHLFDAPAPADGGLEPLRRLELAARLLPALRRVLDVREVFDRLSEIS